MWDKKSGRTFLQKMGLLRTSTYPRPTISPGRLLAHSIPLSPPLPEPDCIANPDGYPPPDRVQSIVWPHEEQVTDDE